MANKRGNGASAASLPTHTPTHTTHTTHNHALPYALPHALPRFAHANITHPPPKKNGRTGEDLQGGRALCIAANHSAMDAHIFRETSNRRDERNCRLIVANSTVEENNTRHHKAATAPSPHHIPRHAHIHVLPPTYTSHPPHTPHQP